MIKLVVVALLALSMTAGCLREQRRDVSSDGKRYQDALCDLIRASDEIVVLEHSCYFDFIHKTSIPEKDIVYRRIVLTKPQRESFLSTMESLDSTTQSIFSLCVPEWHHRIEFFTAGQPTSSMEICFKCSQVSWTGSTATPPGELYQGLATVVKSIGMETNRDWEQLAADHVK